MDVDKVALFVRHRAKPGQRDRLQTIWETWVRPRVEANPAHEVYCFCHDAADPDVLCVFQLFSDAASVEAFMSGDWYPQYLAEVSDVVSDAPQISHAHPQWTKGL